MIDPAAPVIAPPAGTIPTREELSAVIARMGGNMARVAEHYGKDRQQIYRWAKRYDIDVESFRS